MQTYQVVSKELHDQSGVFVAFLAQSIEFSNSIVECLLGKMASLIWGVEYLVIEDRKVKCETKSDWVGRSEVS